MKFEVFFQQDICSSCTNVYFVLTDQNNNRKICEPMNMVFKEMDISISQEPSLQFDHLLSMQFFPALVDGLAKSGYKYESSDVGELKATKVHLDDMRKLVFNK